MFRWCLIFRKISGSRFFIKVWLVKNVYYRTEFGGENCRKYLACSLLPKIMTTKKFCPRKYRKETHIILFVRLNCRNLKLVPKILSTENFVRYKMGYLHEFIQLHRILKSTKFRKINQFFEYHGRTLSIELRDDKSLSFHKNKFLSNVEIWPFSEITYFTE